MPSTINRHQPVQTSLAQSSVMRDQFGRAANDIDKLDHDLNDENGRVRELERDVDELKHDINDENGRLRELERDVGELQHEFDDENGRIKKMEQDLQELDERVDKLRYVHEQASDSNQWQVQHDLDERFVTVQVIDHLNVQHEPSTITFTNANHVELHFLLPMRGQAIIRR